MEQLASGLTGDDVTQAPAASGLTCSYGTPWAWPHDCMKCKAATEEDCRRFDEMVAAGVYNTRGYTLREWKRAGHAATTWRDA